MLLYYRDDQMNKKNDLDVKMETIDGVPTITFGKAKLIQMSMTELIEAATPKTTVWLVGSDNGWDALYINGKAVCQNHGISIRDFMDHLQETGLAKDVDFKSGYVDGKEANREIEDLGCMPDNFSEIEDSVS